MSKNDHNKAKVHETTDIKSTLGSLLKNDLLLCAPRIENYKTKIRIMKLNLFARLISNI